MVLTAVILAVGVIYWLSVSEVKHSQTEQVKNLAQGLAVATSARVNIIQKTVDNAAKLPDVIDSLTNRDADLIHFNEETLQTLIPYSLKIRLLPADVNDIDESSIPAMGFADLLMVQSTLSSPQKPTIQGKGEHRHLAITSLVSQNNQPIGVILASLRHDFLRDLTSQLSSSNGRIEIKQDRLTLASIGSEPNEQEPDNSLPVPGTNWTVVSWTPANTAEEFSLLTIATIFIAGLLVCLSFFTGYRKLVEYLRQDQSTILKAAKDFLAGKLSGNYPVILEEMNPVITSMAQYKRAIDHEEVDLEQLNIEEGDDFFDEGLDTGFLDMTNGIELEEVNQPVIETATPKQPFLESATPIQLNTESSAPPFSKSHSIDYIFRAAERN